MVAQERDYYRVRTVAECGGPTKGARRRGLAMRSTIRLITIFAAPSWRSPSLMTRLGQLRP